jgi:hypothetical protein
MATMSQVDTVVICGILHPKSIVHEIVCFSPPLTPKERLSIISIYRWFSRGKIIDTILGMTTWRCQSTPPASNLEMAAAEGVSANSWTLTILEQTKKIVMLYSP